jgi:site-specific DNA recombinase
MKVGGHVTSMLMLAGLSVNAEADTRIEVPITMQVHRAGARTRMVFEAPQQQQANRDLKLVELLQRAFDSREQLRNSSADALPPNQKHALTREARLSYLAPDFIEAIVTGRQPIELGARRLHRLGALPLCWAEQRKMLGVA